MIASKDVINNVYTYVYDGADRLIQKISPDPDGTGPLTSPVESYSYDPRGLLEVYTDARGYQTVYDYDALGQRTSLTDALGNETTWDRNAWGLVTAETNPLGDVETFVYDLNGWLIEKTDRRGFVTEYEYDNIGRTTGENWFDDGNVMVNRRDYAYDAAGRMTTGSDNFSEYSFVYDLLGQVTSIANDNNPNLPNLTQQYTYDPLGRIKEAITLLDSNRGWIDSMGYDPLGRVTTLTQQSAATTPGTVHEKRVDYTYADGNRVAEIIRSDAVLPQVEGITTTYTYDAKGRIAEISHADLENTGNWTPDTDWASTFSYIYDGMDRIKETSSRLSASILTWRNYYDAAGQLIQVDKQDSNGIFIPEEVYTYDATGNRTNVGYEVGPNNKIESVNGSSLYFYDENGNRDRITVINEGIVDYEFDHKDRLISVIYKDLSNVLEKKVAYTYDIFDRRISKTVDTDGDGDIDTGEFYHYERDQLSFVTDLQGELLEVYFNGPGTDELHARQVYNNDPGDPDTFWTLTDIRNSVRIEAYGDPVTGWYTYTDLFSIPGSFGQNQSENIGQDGSSISVAFTGREYDPDTKLTYFRARWYDDAIGCFIGEDPSGFSAGDVNLTRYVHNDPVNFTDPSELQEMGGYQWDDAKSYAENYKAQMEHDRARIDETIERNRPLQEAALIARLDAIAAQIAQQEAIRSAIEKLKAPITHYKPGYESYYTYFVGEWIVRPVMGDRFLVTASDSDIVLASGAMATTTVLSAYGGWYLTKWIGHAAKAVFGPLASNGVNLTYTGAAVIGGTAAGVDYLVIRGSLNAINPDADDPTIAGTLSSVAGGAVFGIFGKYFSNITEKYAGSLAKYFGRGADDVVVDSIPDNIAGYLAAPVGRTADHHIFPQQFRKFFTQLGINIDDYTITVEHQITHLRGIHGRGNMGQFPGRWNQRWLEFIDNNPTSTIMEVYNFGGRMLDEFGLGHLPIHAFGK